MNNKVFRNVIPCGRVMTEGERFYLLSPVPVSSDWELSAGMLRLVVVPGDSIGQDKSGERAYSFARHLLVHPVNVAIEYMMLGSIKVWDLGVIDLSQEAMSNED